MPARLCFKIRKEATDVPTTPQDKIVPNGAKTAPNGGKTARRKWWRRFKPRLSWFRPRLSWRSGKFLVVGLSLAIIVNYGVFGLMKHEVDANPEFQAIVAPANGSAAVATAAALLDRELNVHGWTPNDPFFAPSGILDNMPNFQIGVINAVGRFSFEMLDQIGRRSGSSSADPDLERASGFLQYPPNIWLWEPSTSFLPSVPSERQYLQGLAALQSYNTRLARGQAEFELRNDTLAAALSRISDDLGSQTSLIDQAQDTGWWMFSQAADDVFYQNKGMLYAYDVILESLGEDYVKVIDENNLGQIWGQAMDSLRLGSQLRPAIVLNGNLDRSIFANHLALQGFFMKRAILQLEEVIGVLAI
ncbi:hypothetical protein DUF2333 [Octadecabacter antarcticus 307]|uniref:DUF2333 family protein n=1 Tax=Octadecabacter antarcticus 307 TaxID=391626 RepID=M9RAR7_9RHOB|nr:hypothetical protein DUF2333 [Octadecabacter antarcticus 307]